MKEQISVFDGHCDTLSLGALQHNEGHLDLERMTAFRHYAQFFAIWADCSGLEPAQMQTEFQRQYAVFQRELRENQELCFCRSAAQLQDAWAAHLPAAFLSVEGAELLGCSLTGLNEAYDLGVRAVNLTWNHANALSGSCVESPDQGLTAAGKAFVQEMGHLGLLVDVSHLSDPGFWDVAEQLEGPFIASHSNARDIFFHPRNLTDEQFTAIIGHNGVAGLNLYAAFLGERPDVDTVVAHLEHWLDLGGAANIAIGADFDGCDQLPAGISGAQNLDRLWERLLQRNYSEPLLRALFSENLMRVVSEVCTT